MPDFWISRSRTTRDAKIDTWAKPSNSEIAVCPSEIQPHVQTHGSQLCSDTTLWRGFIVLLVREGAFRWYLLACQSLAADAGVRKALLSVKPNNLGSHQATPFRVSLPPMGLRFSVCRHSSKSGISVKHLVGISKRFRCTWFANGSMGYVLHTLHDVASYGACPRPKSLFYVVFSCPHVWYVVTTTQQGYSRSNSPPSQSLASNRDCHAVDV